MISDKQVVAALGIHEAELKRWNVISHNDGEGYLAVNESTNSIMRLPDLEAATRFVNWQIMKVILTHYETDRSDK